MYEYSASLPMSTIGIALAIDTVGAANRQLKHEIPTKSLLFIGCRNFSSPHASLGTSMVSMIATYLSITCNANIKPNSMSGLRLDLASR